MEFLKKKIEFFGIVYLLRVLQKTMGKVKVSSTITMKIGNKTRRSQARGFSKSSPRVEYDAEDTKFSASIIVYGDCGDIQEFCQRRNAMMMKNIESYFDRCMEDKAFMVLPIVYEDIFKQNPKTVRKMMRHKEQVNLYANHLLRSIALKFEEECMRNDYSYEALEERVKREISKVWDQKYVKPFFNLTMDTAGVTDWRITEEHISTMDGKKHLRYLNHKHFEKESVGMLKHLLDILEDNRMAVIAHVIIPKGCIYQTRDELYRFYTDYSISISAKGKAKYDELRCLCHSAMLKDMTTRRKTVIDCNIIRERSKYSAVRELEEEIGLSVRDYDKVDYISSWGKIYQFKTEFMNCVA